MTSYKNNSLTTPFYSPRSLNPPLLINPSKEKKPFLNQNLTSQKLQVSKNFTHYDIFKKKMSSPSPNELLLSNLLRKDINNYQKQFENSRPLTQRSGFEKINDGWGVCKTESHRYEDSGSDKENKLNFLNIKKKKNEENWHIDKFLYVLQSQNSEIHQLKDETQKLKKNFNKLQNFLEENKILQKKTEFEIKKTRPKIGKVAFKEEDINTEETEKKKPSLNEKRGNSVVSSFLEKDKKNPNLSKINNYSVLEQLKKSKIKQKNDNVKTEKTENITHSLNILKKRLSEVLNSYKHQNILKK